jgi:predicted GIY-YIG superfamily endonuclease
MTGNLARRVFEHKNKLVPGFTSRYNLARLAYYESFAYPDAAIDRGCESAVAGLSGTVERRVQAGF